ncbi:MAG: glycosyltransferase family 2 protein [bacterium]|nr:glycosyltransferase family 2 protein [bacterium]
MINEIIYSVVVPVFNEEEVLNEVYTRLIVVMEKLDKNYEIIFIDDGSTDKSFEIINKLCEIDKKVRVIQFSRNFGHQIAISAGIDYVSGDAVIMMDADLQHPPELIPELIKKWEEGYDIVYTVRKESKSIGLIKKITSKFFYSLINSLSKIDIPEGTADFRLLSRTVVENLKNFKERTRFIRGLISWVGYKKIGISYIAEARFAGRPKYSFKKMIRFALIGITSFSSVPLYISTILGFIIAGISFIYAIFAIYSKFFTDTVVIPGWTSTLVSVLFLGGVQLIAIGILGEYLDKVYEEVKQRPLYIVKELKGFNEHKI